jgi:hypothetical protein
MMQSSLLMGAFLLLLTLATVASPFASAQTQDWLSNLSERRNYTQQRSSSFDRSGGNADFRAIPPGETLTLLDEDGPATITHIWFTLADQEAYHLKKIVLRMYWDSETTPSVETPLGDFFGLGLGEYFTYQSAPLAVAPNRGLNSFFPMSFQKHARITVGNMGTEKVDAFYFNIDFQRLDKPLAPTVRAKDAFFEFLFSRARTRYDELKRRASGREPLPSFRLDDVKLTFDVNVDYETVRTQLTQNVVAIVEGSDPALKSTYVAFGAHYDHVGYAEGEIVPDDGRERRTRAPGRITPGAIEDRIWNGADDDGSGTVGVMALARAFAQGPRPKRSLLFIWHTGEEVGRYGSLYFADHPTVPIDRIVTQLNIDMIGRNRDDKPSEGNTVYLVGSDRISSELHAVSRAANAALPTPLTLDYEFNDPSDGESLYTRSDHYSYATKGIPVIFFTTGLHPDYHANTDEVSKIDFDKLAHVVQFVYETGVRVASLDQAPVRDNKGARPGKTTATR